MPISRVRSFTPYDNTPNSPSAARPSDKTAKLASRAQCEHALRFTSADRLVERRGVVHHELRIDRREHAAHVGLHRLGRLRRRHHLRQRPIAIAGELHVRVIHVVVDVPFRVERHVAHDADDLTTTPVVRGDRLTDRVVAWKILVASDLLTSTRRGAGGRSRGASERASS
jgi:hypothetical protein